MSKEFKRTYINLLQKKCFFLYMRVCTKVILLVLAHTCVHILHTHIILLVLAATFALVFAMTHCSPAIRGHGHTIRSLPGRASFPKARIVFPHTLITVLVSMVRTVGVIVVRVMVQLRGLRFYFNDLSRATQSKQVLPCSLKLLIKPHALVPIPHSPHTAFPQMSVCV